MVVYRIVLFVVATLTLEGLAWCALPDMGVNRTENLTLEKGTLAPPPQSVQQEPWAGDERGETLPPWDGEDEEEEEENTDLVT